MFELFLTVTAFVVLLAMWTGYLRTSDALMPMTIFGPMLLYVYVYSPAMLRFHDELALFFPDPTSLDYVALVNLVGIGLFALGCLSGAQPIRAVSGCRAVVTRLALDERTRKRVFDLACVFGVTGVLAFVYMVMTSGGFLEVFSRPKPFLSAPSGYVSEARMLAYPAIVLLAITVRSRLRLSHVLLALFFAFPHLTMASLGGRRGPAFLIVITLVVAWYVARNRRPSWRAIVTITVGLGLLMLFLVSNRQNIYLGSDFDFDSAAFTERIAVADGSGGQEFIYASGLILTADYLEAFYWGLRYFTLLFVRPIPRQIWPTKYEDMGLGWMVDEPGTGGFSDWDWLESVGFLPLRGSSGGLVADMFVEFWYFGFIACFLIGYLYGKCWRRSVLQGGLWTVVYVELLALSVYLPAQSVGAWLHRALLMIVPTWIVWKYFVVPLQKRAAASRVRAQIVAARS